MLLGFRYSTEFTTEIYRPWTAFVQPLLLQSMSYKSILLHESSQIDPGTLKNVTDRALVFQIGGNLAWFIVCLLNPHTPVAVPGP
ncbi:hypothetical protein CEXT_581311 [Caerostris extrusa]|uniref:Uncharacterized protein n=1 Tax=Caerostris extrusa TaxID=172846 RepID=A0AAV4S3S4_CAEEX|nr:hypothetical protein CEXT_581311 [Caerostris extrusa]